MPQTNRRIAIQALGMSALAASLGKVGGVIAGESNGDLTAWIDRLYDNAVKLKMREISALQWQEANNLIYGSIAFGKFREHLDFNHLQKKILGKLTPGQGEMFFPIKLPGSADAKKVNGKKPHQYLQTALIHVEKGRSIPPHGHSNMVSAFLCLSGEFEVRLYDRLEERQDHMVVRQTVDEQSAGPGTWSSISDYRDNVHWLKAKTDDCFVFSIKTMNVEDNRPYNARISINVLGAEQIGTGTLRAPKISRRESLELY